MTFHSTTNSSAETTIGDNRKIENGTSKKVDKSATLHSVQTLEVTTFSDITAESVRWIWKNRIPTKLTVIAGQPGTGKSQVTISLAATVSAGTIWPDGEKSEQGSVIFISNEDDPADTVKPRLQAAGADTSRVHIINGVLGLNNTRRSWVLEDVSMLAELCENIGDVKLIIIDPITAYVGKKDGHNTSDVRGLLHPLIQLADRHKLAVIAVSHLNKSQGIDALSRVTGSGAFVAAARTALLVADHPDVIDAKVIAVMKTNLSPEKSGMAYRVVSVETKEGILTSKVEWLPGSIDLDIEHLLAAKHNHESTGSSSRRGMAEKLLKEQLESGPKDGKELYKVAESAGISESTLNRAKKKLNIESIRPGGIGPWKWSLPTLDVHSPPHENVGDVGNPDYLDVDNPHRDWLDDHDRQISMGGQLTMQHSAPIKKPSI